MRAAFEEQRRAALILVPIGTPRYGRRPWSSGSAKHPIHGFMPDARPWPGLSARV